MDLSKLLGDLYETNETDEADAPVDASPAETPFAETPAAAPVTPPPPGPDWADEALLDEAFASWQPGPPADAPSAEREMANGFPATSYPGLQEELSAMALDERTNQTDAEAVDPVDPVDAVDAVDAGPPRMWTRTDDDVLAHRRGGRRGRKLSLRRR